MALITSTTSQTIPTDDEVWFNVCSCVMEPMPSTGEDAPSYFFKEFLFNAHGRELAGLSEVEEGWWVSSRYLDIPFEDEDDLVKEVVEAARDSCGKRDSFHPITYLVNKGVSTSWALLIISYVEWKRYLDHNLTCDDSMYVSEIYCYVCGMTMRVESPGVLLCGHRILTSVNRDYCGV